MAVPVQDEVGRVLGDRTPEAVASEEGPDARRLALDRRRGGRVVEENDAERAVGNGLQPALEGFHLVRGLRIDGPHDGLAEVVSVASGKPPTKPFVPTTPSLVPLQSSTVQLAVQHHDPGGGEDFDDLSGAVGVPVVVAQDGDDRDLELAAGVGEHLRLLGLAKVVRSPARRIASTSPAICANAAATAARFSSPQWMSPAAAIRMASRFVIRARRVPGSCRCPTRASPPCSRP